MLQEIAPVEIVMPCIDAYSVAHGRSVLLSVPYCLSATMTTQNSDAIPRGRV